MRNSFEAQVQASESPKRLFRFSKQVLASAITGPEGLRLPTQRIRNSMCRGFGYSSFSELEFVSNQKQTGEFIESSADQLLHALSSGFHRALNEGRDLGFHYNPNEEQLAAQLAQRTVELFNERENQIANEHKQVAAD
jgi:hypothetical protein